jgi:hypothetical protein
LKLVRSKGQRPESMQATRVLSSLANS